jgi:hypothetical protein
MKPSGFKNDSTGTQWFKKYSSLTAANAALERLREQGYRGNVNFIGGSYRVVLRKDSFMNPTKRSTRKRVSRSLTKFVRNFTGTITRTGDGQVVIAGTGPKPKSNPLRRNPGNQYAVIARDGFFRDSTKVQSTHSTKDAAIKAARRRRVSMPGRSPQSSAMVIQSQDGFSKGQTIYGDTIRSLYPVVW